jgi:5-(aminomethyl)-3-furanmethanol phosphate kinase
MIRIAKVGGSLLDWPQSPAAVRQWLSTQPRAINVLVAGGGALAKAIRKADEQFALGEERSHWLCIDVLSITARILAAAMPEFRLVTSYAELQSEIAKKSAGAFLFDPREFLTHNEARLPGAPLPHDWTATSDSIAARIAECLPAGELVLLKSTDPPSASLVDLAAAGYVDRYFPIAAANFPPPRLVNLRGTAF